MLIEFKEITLSSLDMTCTAMHGVSKFTCTEFRLLHFLMSNANRYLSRDAISLELFGREARYEDRNIENVISRIRKKLRVIHYKNLIVTSRKFGGYKFTATPRGSCSACHQPLRGSHEAM